MLSVEDILRPENVSYTDNVWTWAVAHMLHKGEDWQITTITDTAPIEIVFLSKGDPLTDYLISGNTVQGGTPTPEAPVDAAGCGVKTGNLFNITAFVQGIVPNRCTTSYDSTTNTLTIESNGSDAHTGNSNTYHIPVTGGETYTLGWTTNPTGGDVYIFENGLTDSSHLHLFNSSLTKGTVTMQNDTTFIIVRFGCYAANVTKTYTNIRLNIGSTALHYEPYGYKLPLTVNGTEYLIYLGQVESTRKIKKLVLTGKEEWIYRAGEPSNVFFIEFIGAHFINNSALCTHYLNQDSGSFNDLADKHVLIRFASDGTKSYIGIRDSSITSIQFEGVSELKEYLAAQYANRTPVTVWFVLATPETAVVNAPLMKIGDYVDAISFVQAGVTIPTVAGANTLTVGTTVQPSSMSITGKIREAADV